MSSVLPGRIHTTRLERRVHHEIACMNKTGVASEWLARAAVKHEWIMRLAFPLMLPPPPPVLGDFEFDVNHYLTSHSAWWVTK